MKVDDPGARLEVVGVFEALVTDEPREGCSITRLGRDVMRCTGRLSSLLARSRLASSAGNPGLWGLISVWGRNHAAPIASPPARSAASG